MELDYIINSVDLEAEHLKKKRDEIQKKKSVLDELNYEATMARDTYNDLKNELYLTTDFKGLGITNEKGRQAHIAKQTMDVEGEVLETEDELLRCRRELEHLENEYKDMRLLNRLAIALFTYEGG